MSSLGVKFFTYLLFIFLIFFILAFTFFALLGIEPFDKIPARMLTIFCAVIFLIILWRIRLRENWRKRIIGEEREESLREGGIEEARIFRELSKEETGVMGLWQKRSRRIVNNAWWLITVFGILDAVGVFWVLNSTYEYVEDVILPVYSVPLVLQFLLFYTASLEWPRYQDLRSPVFRVQGKLIKEEHLSKKGDIYKYTIFVRGKKFSSYGLGDVTSVVHGLHNGEEVAVEYSPHTRNIWKIYKTPDI